MTTFACEIYASSNVSSQSKSQGFAEDWDKLIGLCSELVHWSPHDELDP